MTPRPKAAYSLAVTESPPPVPAATVARLPLYLRSLEELERDQVATVSSSRLAELAGVNAAKLRKDLSHLGSYGTRGVGYQVDHLMSSIRGELGLDVAAPVVVVGFGNLGQALVNHSGFAERGFPIAAIIDNDPAKVGGRCGDLVVQPDTAIAEIVERQQVRTAIIATPVSAAQSATDRVVAAGVTSVLNFAPTVVQVPDGVALRQVDLALELQILSYYRPKTPGGRDKWLRLSG